MSAVPLIRIHDTDSNDTVPHKIIADKQHQSHLLTHAAPATLAVSPTLSEITASPVSAYDHSPLLVFPADDDDVVSPTTPATPALVSFDFPHPQHPTYPLIASDPPPMIQSFNQSFDLQELLGGLPQTHIKRKHNPAFRGRKVPDEMTIPPSLVFPDYRAVMAAKERNAKYITDLLLNSPVSDIISLPDLSPPSSPLSAPGELEEPEDEFQLPVTQAARTPPTQSRRSASAAAPTPVASTSTPAPRLPAQPAPMEVDSSADASSAQKSRQRIPKRPRKASAQKSRLDFDADEYDDEDEEYEDRRVSTGNKRGRRTAGHHGTATDESGNCEYLDPITGHRCGNFFTRKYDIPRHMPIHAQKEIALINAGEVTPDRCTLHPQYYTVSQDKDGKYVATPAVDPSTVCPHCRTVFSRRDALNRHVASQHGSDAKKKKKDQKDHYD